MLLLGQERNFCVAISYEGSFSFSVRRYGQPNIEKRFLAHAVKQMASPRPANGTLPKIFQKSIDKEGFFWNLFLEMIWIIEMFSTAVGCQRARFLFRQKTRRAAYVLVMSAVGRKAAESRYSTANGSFVITLTFDAYPPKC